MPKWLRNQLIRAFYGKDRREIRFLNQCWFMYAKKEREHENKSSPPG